jgi:hypothetical protein
MALTDKLTAIADAIRGKTGKTEAMTLEGMATEIAGMETGGGGYSLEELGKAGGIKGDLEIDFPINRTHAFYGLSGIGKVTLKDGFAGSYSTSVASIFEKSSVTEVYADNAGFRLNPSMFKDCKSLKKVVLTCDFGTAVFSGCSALELADITGDIARDQLFNNCSALETVVLRKTSVATILAPTYWAFTFNGTPFDNNPAGTGGTVYVPAALIEEYKVATNWSVLYEAGTVTFAAIEGSEYE